MHLNYHDRYGLLQVRLYFNTKKNNDEKIKILHKNVSPAPRIVELGGLIKLASFEAEGGIGAGIGWLDQTGTSQF